METPEERKQRIQRGHKSLLFIICLVLPVLLLPLLLIQPLGLYVWLSITILWGVSLIIWNI